LHFSPIEEAALRFLSDSICALLTAAKRPGRQNELHGAIDTVHRLIQQHSLILKGPVVKNPVLDLYALLSASSCSALISRASVTIHFLAATSNVP
jgi:hypothetical protein